MYWLGVERAGRRDSDRGLGHADPSSGAWVGNGGDAGLAGSKRSGKLRPFRATEVMICGTTSTILGMTVSI